VLELAPVGPKNWRSVSSLEVAPEQRDFVMSPIYYLALCAYDDIGWRPLAITVDGTVVGFLMWAVDPADGSCWLGGVMIDRRYQGRGYGRQAMQLALDRLAERHGFTEFALSYNPKNTAARALYASLGFCDTDAREDAEIIARHHPESWRRRGPLGATTPPAVPARDRSVTRP
jgi:diamine N-acetyltransferase